LPGGNYLKISVRDNGEGIPEHLLSRIFDPYFTTKSEGSGLGLAICYSIVRKHDGHVAISSTPGSGTIVSVYLPACVAPNDPKPTEAAPSPKGTSGKILIMDDEEELRLIAVELFGALGWEVEAAADGAEALVLYKKAMEEGGRFDLVVTDLTVPGGMGGKEAAARLLELDPTAKLIVSSGYSNDPVMAEWRRYGFAGVLAKPYSVGDIREIAHRVLGRPHPPV
jgi:CheY-like chemotaxis protein